MINDIRKITAFYKSLISTQGNKTLLIVILQIILDCLYMALPLYAKYFIDTIVPSKSLAMLYPFVGVLALNIGGILLAQYIITLLQGRVKLTLTCALDNQILSKILDVSVQSLGQKPGSFHANRIKKDTESVMNFYEHISSRLVSQIVTAIWAIVYALTVNIWIAVIIAVVFFPLYFFIGKYYDRMREQVFAVRDQACDIETFRYETLAGLRSLKLWLAHKFRMETYKKRYTDYINKSVKLSVAEYYPSLFQELFLEYLPTLLVFLFGGYLVLKGNMTIGQWIALDLYSSRFIGSFTNVINVGGKLPIIEGTIKRLQEYLLMPSESNDLQQNTVLPNRITQIKLDNISYAYPDKTVALQEITFECVAGRVYALVGSSGAGKSTIANILAGLYSPQKGQYLINNIAYEKLPVDYIRSRISIASISDFIFSESISDNIRIAKTTTDESGIEQASILATANEFIKETKSGYNTYLGENGLGLSEGQIQRIILARMFLKGGDIVVLDEATASLDSETEKKVLQNVLNSFKDRIVIFITHHPSVAKLADEIIVLAEGSLIDTGTHEELCRRNKYYNALINRGANPLK
ncbi:MAG: ATP-binding cassette domain-containing protein [bacterium]|nr:ATP-binding cassette domain-containing protein [bacterium]